MLLKDLIYRVSLVSISGHTDVETTSIAFDSRMVEKGNVFVAVKGVSSDGHQYIQQVIDKGITQIVCEDLPEKIVEGVTFVQVKDSSEALGIMSSNFFGNPSSKLKLVGITGTNGKTTTVTMLYALFKKLGYTTGLLSTVENKINDRVIPSTHTTPDAFQLNKLLFEMVNEGCTHCFMEVSSHSIVQHRIAGLNFTGALFSNITHDHLDYHKTFEEYIKAKKMFFDGLSNSAFSLVNIDDKRGRVMIQNTRSKTYSYSLQAIADFKGKLISSNFQGLEMEVDGLHTWFKVIGKFNAYNIMVIYGAAIILGEDKMEVLTQLSTLNSAQGRFEQYVSKSGVNAIVDYAHTPDALENVLKTIKEILPDTNKLITVVGCGGDRDPFKRPLMAEISVRYSNQVVFTSDNPRSEDPQMIVDEMKKGIKITEAKKVLTVLDRKEAIRVALQLAQSGDVVLVAGKGHETYQEINKVKHPFSDKEVIKEIFNQEA
jgi:UDP-N-acetylmuramoyl-L-alanyl-D-glutamate--2,6-diaminopimelate ligase